MDGEREIESMRMIIYRSILRTMLHTAVQCFSSISVFVVVAAALILCVGTVAIAIATHKSVTVVYLYRNSTYFFLRIFYA